MKTKLKKEEFKKIIINNLETTTIHAIPNIVRSNNYLARFIWISCLLLSSGYFSFEIYKSKASFYDYGNNN